MIYVCIGTDNNARTVGLVLWKLRKVFAELPREYEVLLADDASGDETVQVVESYQGAVPMILTRNDARLGPAATLEGLLRTALQRSERPRRDLVVTLPADFSVSPDVLPTIVRAFESGADLVVAETADSDPSAARRLVRRGARWLLRPGIRVPGIGDYTSGVLGIRLATLGSSLREGNGQLLTSAGIGAFAELLARTACVARQTVAFPARRSAGAAPAPSPSSGAWSTTRPGALRLARDLWIAGRRLRIPPPGAPARRWQ